MVQLLTIILLRLKTIIMMKNPSDRTLIWKIKLNFLVHYISRYNFIRKLLYFSMLTTRNKFFFAVHTFFRKLFLYRILLRVSSFDSNWLFPIRCSYIGNLLDIFKKFVKCQSLKFCKKPHCSIFCLKEFLQAANFSS